MRYIVKWQEVGGVVNLHVKHASHLPALVDALAHTEGPVLELGTGVISTFALHWLCLHQGRTVVSYENSLKYYKVVKHCRATWHDVRFIEDWDSAPIERPWSVALVDHAPAERRKVDIARLADWAQVIVVHDAQWSLRHFYHYDEVWSLFEYRRNYRGERRVTTLVSRFVDVTQWQEAASGVADG